MDFDNTNLSRIDLYYDRKLKESDRVENFDSFLEKCCTQIKEKYSRKTPKVEKGVLRVGKRGSGNYFRLYRRPNGKDIRFELELKKSAIKKFQSYLFFILFTKFFFLQFFNIRKPIIFFL